jgi:DNA polymerase delta subunit 1
MDEVTKLARKHGVIQKIDPFELQYDHQPWYKTLTEFEFFSSKCPPPVHIVDLACVDPHKYYNGHQLKKQVAEKLHAGYDFTTSEGLLEKIKNRPSFITPVTQVTPPPVPEGNLEAHIVDVSWENFKGGAKILLYTRDCTSSTTSLVTVPYRDYFYVELSDGVTAASVRKAISGYDWYMREKRFPESNFPPERILAGTPQLVLNTYVVDDVKSVYGYQHAAQSFLKVITVSPTVTNVIFNGLSKKNPSWKWYEANTDYVNKFLTEYRLSGCAPVHVSHCNVQPNHLSTCDRLIEAALDDVRDWPEGPMYEPRTFYYDIECLSLDPDTFPTSDCCPIIQISYLLSTGFTEEARGVLCLHDTPGSTIYESFETEDQMLIKFAQIIRSFNPDAITGFNSNNFDMPYIMDRMDVLGIEFAKQMSRRAGYVCDYKRTFKQSKQFGTKEVIKYVMPGRLMFDFFEVIKADVTKKLRSYSLKSICAEYLGDDNKEDLRYRDIPDLFKVPEGRAKIASYCMKDTALLLELDKKLMLGVNTWALTKVLGVTPDVAVNRGLVHKLMCKLKQYTERYDFVIPTFTEDQKPSFAGKYQGAFVLDPDVGFHEDPVCVLDYASLYPSLMIYYNLSYDSYLPPGDPGATAWKEANPDKWEEMDGGACFVKPDEYFGIVPRLEQELGKQRKAAKKKKAQATDPLSKAMFDGEQLAVKVIMNSLYGMLGSPTATVPCVEIASSITAMGRHNLMAAKEYVEKNYCEFTGEPPANAAKVVYGDTDSIFIKMPNIGTAKAMEYGKLLEHNITRDLYSNKNALVMEYEKIFNPLLLVTAKRYVGNKYEFDPNECKLNVNGLQLVKRDSAVLCVETMQGFFDRVFKDKDNEAAGRFVEESIRKLYADETPLDYFRLTKKLSKRVQDYDVIPPHIGAWQRMVQRVGKTEAPSIGEMFDYIITRVDKRQKGLGDSMVDFELAKEKNLATSIDKNHYFKLAMDKPLRDPMNLILGKATTDRILNPNNYQQIETVVPKKGNILAAFGMGAVTNKRKAPPGTLTKEMRKDLKKSKN